MRIGIRAAALGASVALVFGLPTAAPAFGQGTGDIDAPARDLAGAQWSERSGNLKPRTTDPWPGASSVLAAMHRYGVAPTLETGYDDPLWQSNANMGGYTTDMRAVMIHDTGTGVPAPQLRTDHSLNWIMNGVQSSAHNTVRACHVYIDRLGQVYVVYLGRTWHAGAGDSMFGVPDDRMNAYSMGIEIESEGGGVQDLTTSQIASATRVSAALLDAGGLPTSRAINHKDWAGRKQGKVDTAYPMTWWQAKIEALRNSPSSVPNPALPTTDSGSDATGTESTVTVVSKNRRHLSMAALRAGSSSAYVARYQSALRRFGSRKNVRVARYNPSGATGYYGHETQALTRAVLKELAKRSERWRRYWKHNPHHVPRSAFVRRIGMIPIR